MYLLRKVYTHIRIMIGTSETYPNNKQKQYTVMLVLPASPTKTKNNTQWCSSYLQALQNPKTIHSDARLTCKPYKNQKQYTVMLVLPASPTKTKNTASFMLSWYESLLKSHWNQVGAFLVFIALYRPTITSWLRNQRLCLFILISNTHLNNTNIIEPKCNTS